MDFIPTHFDKHKKIWSGPKTTPVYHPDCSIGKIVFNQLKNFPKNVMQISDVDGSVVTNYDMFTWSVRIAQYFKKLRLRHDDVIGIAAKNTKYVSAAATGALFNACPFHAVNPAHDEKTLSHLFGLTKPKVIFCDGDAYDKVYQATKSINPLIYTLSDHIDKVPSVEELLNPTGTEMFYQPEPAILGNDQTVVILCSSGTTGLPKAVCLSNSYMKVDVPIGNSEDVLYNSSTLDWLTGLFAYILSVTMGCTRIITNKPFTAEYFVELVKKYEVTWTMVAPRHLSALANCPTATPENLRTVRVLSCGGGFIALPTLQRTEKIFPNALINFGYGLTECGGVSSNIGLENGTSVGKVSPNVRVRIVDPESGQNLGPNEVGEIFVHNGNEWNGYYSNPMETQRILDSLGWFHTGDLGYFDDRHYLYVVDRLKDICKYQGVQYWPNEIEEEVLKMPEVADACVFGVYDEQNGDKASALVVRANGSKVSEAEIKQHVSKKFTMLCKQLHGGVIFTDKIPQSANGKSDRRAAKEIFVKLASNKNNVDR